MAYKIAVPIIGPSMDDALRQISDAEAQTVDFIELRIDCIKDPDLERLVCSTRIPKIVTVRHRDEGGNPEFEGSEDDRFAYFDKAIDLGAEYIDVELDHYRKLPRNIGNTKLIISHHNFTSTPNDLNEIYRRLTDVPGQDIIKLATKATVNSDNERMLDFIQKNPKQEKIGICMGEEGIPTRIWGPYFGSYLTFAALNKEQASAPGQLTVDELRAVWKMLGFIH